MAFTKRKITHKFEEASGAAASGSVTFRLTKRMTNGTTTIVPSELTAQISESGEISQELTSNQDSGTTPEDAQWAVDIRLGTVATIETFSITVPTGPGTTDLGGLLPTQPQGG